MNASRNPNSNFANSATDGHLSAEIEDHDRRLDFDLSTLLQRRNLFKMFAGGAGLIALAACGSDAKTATTTAKTNVTAATSATDAAAASTTAATTAAVAETTAAATASCEVIPEETAGPYPGDGSNGVNVLTESGIVRSDIRSSFGSSTTVAEGILVTINLTIQDSANGCAPLAGGAVYLWHCDIDGQYSLYSSGVTGENYLRGVQEADANGLVTFTSIFPACYDGRWPHIHFEVYPTLDSTSSADNKIATSQLALPQDVCDVVFATSGYETSVNNMTRVSLATDNVFSDGASLETPIVTGSVADGYVLTMSVTV